MTPVVILCLLIGQAQDERKAVDRAIDHLLKTQQDDGSWRCRDERLEEHPELKRFGKIPNPARVFSTSLAGMALLRHGARPTSDVASGRDLNAPLRRARDYVVEYVTVGQKSALCNPTWILSFAGIFLARVHALQPSDETARALQAVVRGLEEFVEPTGAWGHGRVDRPNLKLSVGYNDLAASHNWVGVALHEIRRAGTTVPEAMVKRWLDFYSKAQYESGGLAYNIEGRGRNDSERSTLGEGRSVAAALPLRRLAPKSKECERALGYLREHLDDVITHHTPWLHLTAAAMVTEEMGEKERAEFDRLYLKRVIERQAEDGSARAWLAGREDSRDLRESFRSRADRDDENGPAYMTACMLLILPGGPGRTVADPKRPDTPTGDHKRR